MSYRKTVFATGQFYHIYNKTVASEQIFDKLPVFKRSLAVIDFYRHRPDISYSAFKALGGKAQEIRENNIFSAPPSVEIHSFSLMPNHFHFLIKQLENDGISRFISNFQNSLARYYNIRYKREGKLFKEMFQAKIIENDIQLIHISRYIHLNPVTSYLINIDNLENYQFTSFSKFMGKIQYSFVDTSFILKMFNNKPEMYKKFVYDQSDYQRKLRNIRHLIK